MTPRDMSPDELEVFEAELVDESDEFVPEPRPASKPEVAQEIDRDNPAAYRVPS
jgi:hypothetical protein